MPIDRFDDLECDRNVGKHIPEWFCKTCNLWRQDFFANKCLQDNCLNKKDI